MKLSDVNFTHFTVALVFTKSSQTLKVFAGSEENYFLPPVSTNISSTTAPYQDIWWEIRIEIL